MEVRVFSRFCVAIAFLFAMSGAAGAVTVTPNPFINGSIFVDSPNFIDSQSFSVDYDTTVTSNQSVLTQITDVFLPPPPNNVTRNLSFVWTFADTSLSTVINITDGSGALLSALPAALTVVLLPGVNTLTISGDVASDQVGGYNVQLEAVPLPPAIIAFLSALLGMGWLSRRRRTRENKDSSVPALA